MAQQGSPTVSRRALLRWGARGSGGLAGGALVAACSGGGASQPREKLPGPPVKPAGGTPATVTATLTNPAVFIAPKTRARQPTRLTLWQSVGPQVGVQRFIAEEYQRQHDVDVSLEITTYPGPGEQRTTVTAALAAGATTPDIIAVEPGAQAVELALSKGVLGFGKVFEADPEYRRGFWPNILSLLTINGETMAVPAATDTVAIYHNRRLFAEAGAKIPETIDGLRALAPLFASKGVAPLIIASAEDRAHALFPFYTLVGGLRAEKVLRDADLGKVSWLSPELVEAAQRTEQLMRSDLLARGVAGTRQADAIQQFAAGKVAMLWAGQWLRPALRQALPPDLELGLFSFPAITSGGSKATLSSTGLALTVNARSQQPELAFEMIKAITGAWGKIEYSKALGLSPNGPISAEAIAYQLQSLKDALYPEFVRLQPTGTTRVLFTPSVETVLAQGWPAVFAGQKSARQLLEETEAASKKAGARPFTVG